MTAGLTGSLMLPLLAPFIGLPAGAAWRRRRLSRAASEAANDLSLFAAEVQRAACCLPLDASLRARLVRLRVAEMASLELAIDLARGDPALLAEVAQRLSSRLRRRVAFERKMLARTASGLRRGAVAASLPPAIILALSAVGVDIPALTQGILFILEASGCALLWRLARVGI
jgi:Flp pilus assembly protein TadB